MTDGPKTGLGALLSKTGREYHIERALRDLGNTIAIIRRYAARDLGLAREPRAVSPLADLVLREEDPEVKIEAARALARIGGDAATEALKRSGLASDPRLVEEEAAPLASGAAAPREAPPKDPTARRQLLVEHALEGTEIAGEAKPYGYRLEVPLPRGRKQMVRIAFDRSRPGEDPILLIITLCGPSRPDLHGWALKQNRLLRHGRLAIDEVSGQEVYVLLDALPDTVDPIDLRDVILAIAADGDWVEEQLTGKDEL